LDYVEEGFFFYFAEKSCAMQLKNLYWIHCCQFLCKFVYWFKEGFFNILKTWKFCFKK
jgi:hypothetical protein